MTPDEIDQMRTKLDQATQKLTEASRLAQRASEQHGDIKDAVDRIERALLELVERVNRKENQ